MFGLARSPLWRDQLTVSAKRRCSKPTFLVSIVNRLGADVKANYHEQNTRCLEQWTPWTSFDTLGSPDVR